jgi:hypothetical protein
MDAETKAYKQSSDCQNHEILNSETETYLRNI